MKTKINKVVFLECITSACPVQYEGKLETGESLYIRERHNDMVAYVNGEVVHAGYCPDWHVLSSLEYLFDFSAYYKSLEERKEKKGHKEEISRKVSAIMKEKREYWNSIVPGGKMDLMQRMQ